MNIAKRFYLIGSWALTILGIGHLIGHFTIPKTAEAMVLADSMRAFEINLLGTKSNLFLFHEGFSLMMGILCLSYGLLNLASLNHNAAVYLSNKQALIVNIVAALATCILSITNFFIVPISLAGIAFFSFLIVAKQQPQLN